MFPLSDGKLIRLNKDGTSRETIVSDKSNIVFGTRILCDHQIKDAGLANDVECEISTDNCGRVSGQIENARIEIKFWSNVCIENSNQIVFVSRLKTCTDMFQCMQ